MCVYLRIILLVYMYVNMYYFLLKDLTVSVKDLRGYRQSINFKMMAESIFYLFDNILPPHCRSLS